jgi:hypothetical protein
MKGLKEDVQQVRAGRAALGEAIGCLPFPAIQLPIAETSPQPSVEVLEHLHQLWGHPGSQQRPK